MIHKKFHSRKSFLIFFLLFILSQMFFPPIALSEEAGDVSDGRDRVLFMIAEKNIEDTHFFYWWSWWGDTAKSEFKAEVVDISSASITLQSAFIKAGFIVVDPGAVKGDIIIEDAYRVEDLTVKSTTGFGKVIGADIVIKGRAIARAGFKKPEANLGVYMADVTAQAIRVSDGRVLASAMGHGVTRHMSATSGAIEALSRAGEDLAKELIEQMGID